MMRARNATNKKQVDSRNTKKNSSNSNSDHCTGTADSQKPNPKSKPRRPHNILQASLSFIILSSAACFYYKNFALQAHLSDNVSQEESLLSFLFRSYYGSQSESESNEFQSYGYSNTNANDTTINYRLIQNLATDQHTENY